MAVKRSSKVTGGIVGAVIICTPLVAQFEGLWTTAKPDKLAYGLPTVCYGETEGVKVGDKYTKAQCDEMLAKKLPRYLNSALSCITVPVSDRQLAAYGSLTYNIGEAAFCRSTVVKKLNAGDPFGSCDALMSWTRAGGKFVQGLANRRAKERDLCIQGIADQRPLEFPTEHKELSGAPEKVKVKLSWWSKLLHFFAYWSK